MITMATPMVMLTLFFIFLRFTNILSVKENELCNGILAGGELKLVMDVPGASLEISVSKKRLGLMTVASFFDRSLFTSP
jgi:hypothetical protein